MNAFCANTVLRNLTILSALPECEYVCVCVTLCWCDLIVGQVHSYKNVACERRRLLGFPHERHLWKSHTCCGLHKEPSNAPVQRDCTSPASICVCVCRRARRKRGAVGVRAVSCWWEWDKNLFPLPKPSALSEASVFFHEATHTETNTHTCRDTHLQRFALKIEKVGAREDNSAGHSHFLRTCVYAPQPLLVSVTCWIVRGWNSFDSADTRADKSLGSDMIRVCVRMHADFNVCVRINSMWRSRWSYLPSVLNIPWQQKFGSIWLCGTGGFERDCRV